MTTKAFALLNPDLLLLLELS